MTNGEILVQNKNLYDINPLSFGYEKCSSCHKFGPSIRRYFLIHYVCEGEGVFANTVGTYRVKKGDIFIILPGELTVYTADNDNPWEYIWVGFTGKVAEKLFSLDERVIHYGENTFFSMLKAELNKSTREEFLAGKIFEIISEIFKEESLERDYVKQAQDYISACFMKNITAESVAETVGVSRRYLSRLFKKRTGEGVQSYIIKTRIEAAKKTLVIGAAVSECAHLCGFADGFNFSKTFKKQTGISPSKYKNYIKKTDEF